MSARSIRTLSTVLAALLLVSAALFLFSRSESVTSPTAFSTLPSGLGAFREVLQASGIQVRADRSQRPEIADDEIAVACVLQAEPKGPNPPKPDKRTVQALRTFAASGGTVLELQFPADFQAASLATLRQRVRNGAHSAEIVSSAGDHANRGLAESTEPFGAWASESGPVVTVSPVGPGTWVTVHGALGATNRFLAEADDASFFAGLVETLARQRKAVFVEGTLGHAERKGLLGSLGAWAVVAQWQALLLLLVVGVTLGQRFGLPEEDVPPRRGSRQLIEALAEVFRGSSKRTFAAQILLEDGVRRASRALRLRPGASAEELDRKAGPRFRALHEACVRHAEAGRADLPSLQSFLAAVEDLERGGGRGPGLE